MTFWKNVPSLSHFEVESGRGSTWIKSLNMLKITSFFLFEKYAHDFENANVLKVIVLEPAQSIKLLMMWTNFCLIDQIDEAVL